MAPGPVRTGRLEPIILHRRHSNLAASSSCVFRSGDIDGSFAAAVSSATALTKLESERPIQLPPDAFRRDGLPTGKPAMPTPTEWLVTLGDALHPVASCTCVYPCSGGGAMVGHTTDEAGVPKWVDEMDATEVAATSGNVGELDAFVSACGGASSDAMKASSISVSKVSVCKAANAQ